MVFELFFLPDYCLHHRETTKVELFKSWPTAPQAAERTRARRAMIQAIQRHHFGSDILRISKRVPIAANNHLNGLSPFLDAQGILSIGGRLQNAPLTYNEKHPIILPSDAHITSLLINKSHIATMHGHVQLTVSVLSRTYWIIRGRNLIKRILKRCVRCARYALCFYLKNNLDKIFIHMQMEILFQKLCII